MEVSKRNITIELKILQAEWIKISPNYTVWAIDLIAISALSMRAHCRALPQVILSFLSAELPATTVWQWQDSSPAFADNFIAFIKQRSYLWHHNLRCHGTAVSHFAMGKTVIPVHPQCVRKLRMYGSVWKPFYSNDEPKCVSPEQQDWWKTLCWVTTGLLQRVCEAGSRPGAEANTLEISHLCFSVLSEETLGKFLMALDDQLRSSHVFV